jgi:hypothetical protein
MTGSHRIGLGLCLLAVVLCGKSAPRVSFAKESSAKIHHSVASKGKANTSENPRGVNPAGFSGKDSDRIDIRITVQPHSPTLKRTTIKPLVRGSPRSYGLSRPEPSAGVVRNVIGVKVPARENPSRLNIPISAHTAVAGRTGNAAVAAPNVKPFVRPTAPNSGAINGTTPIRRGSGPSSIGGSGRAVAGINGTAIRPKH